MREKVNELKESLRDRANKAEKNIEIVKKGKYRCKYHLMPPVGWLNDPNGLCKVDGVYHVFFQYAPESAEGAGMRSWGHYSSADMLKWKFHGVAIYPDTEYDKDGAYSGSAVVEEKGISVYYTGNVKHKDKEYDYISDGRESNTILIKSQDVQSFDNKKVLMGTVDYPKEFTRHIRDPKVVKSASGYKMILGGRLTGDKGAALIYNSRDGENFVYEKTLTTEKPFGYMWECPDFFELDGEKFICISPQGLKHEKYIFQNRYSSGYFVSEIAENKYREWDIGFDFYAPQSFFDGNRRILYGWAGMPDAEYDNEPSVKEGWQHLLTLPRKLSYRDGKLYQMVVDEITGLREREVALDEELSSYEMIIRNISTDLKLVLCDALEITIGEEDIKFEFTEDKVGRGRKERYARVKAKEMRVFMDVSMCEIYINGGESVFTTKLYPDNYSIKTEGDCQIARYAMRAMDIEILKN